MRVEVLECDDCGKQWERPPTRGRKPKFCDGCKDAQHNSPHPRPQKTYSTDTEQLLTAAQYADDLTRRIEALKTPEAAQRRQERITAILAARAYGGKR